MKLTVLGSCGPYPRAGGACSGYLLETENSKILLDCGNGTLSRLQEIIDIFNDLDMIILTHLHSDHISDAMVLKYAFGIKNIKGNSKKSIPLYTPSSPKEEFDKLQFNNAYKLKKIEESLEVEYKDLLIKFTKMDHPVPCYGVEISDNFKKFVYSGDTKYCDAVFNISKDADVFLCESGLLEKDKTAESNHLSAKEAAEIANKSGVKKLILTHFWPEYNLDDIYNEAKQRYNGELELATEMKTYII